MATLFQKLRKTEDRSLAPPTTSPGWTDYGGDYGYGAGDYRDYGYDQDGYPGHHDLQGHRSLAISDAYACVRALSDAVASLPLIAYRRHADGTRERLTGGRLVDLLRSPAPATTQANLTGQMMAHLTTFGNCYLGKYRDDQGVVTELGLLDPTRVQPRLERGVPLYRYSVPQGEVVDLTSYEVLHIRGMSSDGIVGLSPVRCCRETLSLSRHLTQHASDFFKGEALPNGILNVQNTSPEAFAKLTAQWAATREGRAGWHKIALLAGDATFSPVSFPLEDQQFLQQRQLSATEVSRIFRVPPWIIGAQGGDSMTYANVSQQAEHFVKFSLAPWLTLIEQAISGDPDLSPSPVYVEFLTDALLRGDTTERYAVYAQAIASGVLTVNECRAKENLPPLDEPPVDEPEPPGPPIVGVPMMMNTNGGAG